MGNSLRTMNQRQPQGHTQVQQQRRSELSKQKPVDNVQRFHINFAELYKGLLLGYGRYGRVYKHTCNGTTVAVKDIAVSALDKESLKKFIREGEIHKLLYNKHIITLHDTQLLEQNLLLVMEFAAGGSLNDILKQYFHRLTLSVVTDWTAQIAEGMRYLHDVEKIVHRDLKSSNILVLEPIEDTCLTRKTLKIADFGLALDGHEKTRTMSEPKGTICWMAPEVVAAPHLFSKASDVWSFGVVVWNMLTGKQPFENLTINFEVTDGDLRIIPFYEGLLKSCWTAEHGRRPTFDNILRDVLRRKEQEELESTELGASYFPPSPPLQQQKKCFFFGEDSTKFSLPTHVLDIALAQDRRSLLLAAAKCGLIELCCVSQLKLSGWRPPKHCGIQDDCVLSVAALTYGRAAVSLRYGHLIVLLKQNEQSCSITRKETAPTYADDDAWTVNLRFGDQLPWAPWWLSTHGDILAACEWRGMRLQLLNVNSGRRLSDTEVQSEYEIGSLAVAAEVFITGSRDKVMAGSGGRLAHVLDARSLKTDGGSNERLWRHVLSCGGGTESELVICADSNGGCLYAALRNWQKILITALSLKDGNELRCVDPSFYFAEKLGLLLPMRLSLCDDESVNDEHQSGGSCSRRVLLLAVLWYHPKTREQRNATLHRSTGYT